MLNWASWLLGQLDFSSIYVILGIALVIFFIIIIFIMGRFVNIWVQAVTSGAHVTFLDLIVFTALAMAIFVGYYSRHPRVRSGELGSALPRWRRSPIPVTAERGPEKETS